MNGKMILITGLPATGKTTIGKKLAHNLRLPFFSKDVVKELFFDALETTSREWSKKIGAGAYDTLFYIIEEELKAGRHFIVESNFKNEWHTEIFKKLQEKYHNTTLQIFCGADGSVVCERFIERAKLHDRHPGHDDTSFYSSCKDTLIKGWCEPLDLEGTVIKVDTTDFKNVHYDEILKKAERFLNI